MRVLQTVITSKATIHCIAVLFAAILLCPVAARAQGSKVDLDHDGIPDDLEQALLEKFRPIFLINADDCDGMPAEFVPGSRSAIARKRNGTIYGQVFPPLQSTGIRASSASSLLEIHYYHLWAKDCGRMGHDLDAEHVAVLVQARAITAGPAEWTAVWWYAAAHENTVCDRSTIARASSLAARDRGPEVWISAGKHAAYFRPADCDHGCGQDRCTDAITLFQGQLINLGEPQAPLNGAIWAQSPKWPLSAKMQTSFAPSLLAQIRDSEAGESSDAFGAGVDSALARSPASAMQGVISAGGSTLDGIDTGEVKTASALSLGAGQTGHALGATDGKVRGALSRAGRAVVRWFSPKAGDHHTPDQPRQ